MRSVTSLLAHLPGLNDVAFGDILVTQRDTALVALADLGDVVLLATQGLDLEVLGDNHTVAHQASLGSALDRAGADDRTGDVAELAGAEDLTDLRGTQLDLLVDRLEHALEGSLNVVDRRVDDVVVLDLDALGIRHLGHALGGTDVEADDDRVVDGRQVDVNLATVDNAVIIGFNVRPAERVAEMADAEGVEIKYYNVIYSAIDDIEAALKGMLKPIYEEVQLGTAEIRQVFRSGKFGNIAGSIVRSGTIKRGTKARLVRDGVVVAENLEIQSLRREKDDVTEVREGYECGITLGHKDIAEGDIIETWEMREKARD